MKGLVASIKKHLHSHQIAAYKLLKYFDNTESNTTYTCCNWKSAYLILHKIFVCDRKERFCDKSSQESIRSWFYYSTSVRGGTQEVKKWKSYWYWCIKLTTLKI